MLSYLTHAHCHPRFVFVEDMYGGTQQAWNRFASKMTALDEEKFDYSEEALAELLSPTHFVEVRRTEGGPAPAATGRALAASRELLRRDQDWWTAARDGLKAAERALRERSERL